MTMQHLHNFRRAGSSSSTSSSDSSTTTVTDESFPPRSCEGMTEEERRSVWKCMLALQRRYGCYNSTRIDLAVNAGEEGLSLMPNPFIIDTLNHSVTHLPDEGWQMLDRSFPGMGSPPIDGRALKLRFWRRP
ncbi:hypothetical protein CP532_4915 [Ophiocordyceps camponoti-leonardi (nom. inval.)]|nr:hypothetical protein CP532_4915 [Ophiocordyceps camponoti-leonardi (nom. inval.)]